MIEITKSDNNIPFNTGPYITIMTDRIITNRYDNSKLPVGAVFEVIEKGYGKDVLGMPSNDVQHVIRVDREKLHFDFNSTCLTINVYLKDLNIPFVNLASPDQPRKLRVSVYLEFSNCVTNKITYDNEIMYDGFHGMWYLTYNNLREPHYYTSYYSSITYYRNYPRVCKTLVNTQQEAATLVYDVSPRQLIIVDPFYRPHAYWCKESLFQTMVNNKTGSYLEVHIYTDTKEHVGSFIKEWTYSNEWGNARFRDNLLKLDFPPELAARIKYGDYYRYYITFYNPVIGKVGYTRDLIRFHTPRIYGLEQTITMTPHIKGEHAFWVDINTKVTKPKYAINGNNFINHMERKTHIEVIDPETRLIIGSGAINNGDSWNFTEIVADYNYYYLTGPKVTCDFIYKKSYIIRVINEYIGVDGNYGLFTQPYEQLVTFDTLDAGCNPLSTPPYVGELRYSKEDKSLYVKLPQFTSFTGDQILKDAYLSIYLPTYSVPASNPYHLQTFGIIIPLDKVPIEPVNSETSEEIVIPLNDETITTYKPGYYDLDQYGDPDWNSGPWNEADCVIETRCEIRYTSTANHDIRIVMRNSRLHMVDPYREGWNSTGP